MDARARPPSGDRAARSAWRGPGDVVVIAGKGHEQGQQFGDTRAAVRRPHGRARGAGRGGRGMIALTAPGDRRGLRRRDAVDGHRHRAVASTRARSSRAICSSRCPASAPTAPGSSADGATPPGRRWRVTAAAADPDARHRRARPADRARTGGGARCGDAPAPPWSASPARRGRPRPRTSWRRCSRAALRTVASPANFNTEIGVPLTLWPDRARHRGGRVRAGHAGDGPDRLSGRDLPSRRGRDHGGRARRTWSWSGTVEAVAEAKAEILDSLGSDGTAVVPHGERLLDPYLSLSRARIVTFGEAAGADVRLDRFRGRAGGDRGSLVEPCRCR